jgi:hypothetical protein
MIFKLQFLQWRRLANDAPRKAGEQWAAPAPACRRGIFASRHGQTNQALTQVPGTGQTSSQRGMSEWPSHSVHFLGLITNVSPFMEIAAFGHSNSQRLQPVQLEAMIL